MLGAQILLGFQLRAPFLLALRLGAGIFVITGRITESRDLAAALGISASCVMLAQWLFWPWLQECHSIEGQRNVEQRSRL